jgi:hypothetical protein
MLFPVEKKNHKLLRDLLFPWVLVQFSYQTNRTYFERFWAIERVKL